MEVALCDAFPTGESMNPNQTPYETTANDMAAGAENTMDQAKRQLNDVLEDVSERAREYGRYADETVQQNPWTAVGVGFGAGLIIGALLMLAARR
jgi:ElaB/YqjD/DUF883 family membrane-anchored ribosome-binding protein